MLVRLTPYQAAALYNPYDHFAMLGGVSIGKTYTGSQYTIKNLREHPECWGFVGANTYDQMSQATLRELIFWLDYYKLEYVIDTRPPLGWGVKKSLKSYRNTISVRVGKHVPTIFTRILSKPNPLRGIEFSWYWMDESRDTPKNTHEVILSRMRETDYIKGLITSTPNVLDWVHDTFVLTKSNDRMFGAMHVPTIEAVRAGLITTKFYNQLVRSYSLQMVLQELWAMHVNALQGRAYHSASERNKLRIAPWGESKPNPNRPLIVACDFNYSPAPCVWVVGQRGPNDWANRIHWFGEVAEKEVSTRTMARKLLGKYPGFFYRFFGDASGTRATTANAGQTDYIQIAEEMAAAHAPHSISVESANPPVRERVETVNALLLNGLNETVMTYDHVACPYLDGDMQVVGWDKATSKLSNGGDVKRTHASDAIGYYCYKEMPMGRRLRLAGNVPRETAGNLEEVL